MLSNTLAASVVVMLMVGCPIPGSATAPPLRSGMYEGFVLAVSPSGHVAGRFNMAQGEGVTKRCSFYFVGQATGTGATVRVVGATGLSGRLAGPSAEEVTFSMARVRSLPGCGMVLPPEVEGAGGFAFDRIRAGNWSELARITGSRVALRAAPDSPVGRAYLVKGDTVGVLARRVGQLQVIYPSERSQWAQGWVSAADLAIL